MSYKLLNLQHPSNCFFLLAFRGVAGIVGKRIQIRTSNYSHLVRNFSGLSLKPTPILTQNKLAAPLTLTTNTSILQIAQNINQTQVRTVTKFSLKSGKRKTVKAALKRFKRLDWGGWIRTHSGRNKKLWKKSHNLRHRLRQHVICNSQQSWLLDKMVTKYWRRPKYYVNDPYTPYHEREEFLATKKKPLLY